jgi:hypothetical protein
MGSLAPAVGCGWHHGGPIWSHVPAAGPKPLELYSLPTGSGTGFFGYQGKEIFSSALATYRTSHYSLANNLHIARFKNVAYIS